MTGRELFKLGERARACRGWAWMSGMVTLSGIRVYAVNEDGTCDGLDDDSEYLDADPVAQDWIPHLGDAATLGCLLQLVRDAYDDPGLYARMSETTRDDNVREWEVRDWVSPQLKSSGRAGSYRSWGASSEAEALVDALEAVLWTA